MLANGIPGSVAVLQHLTIVAVILALLGVQVDANSEDPAPATLQLVRSDASGVSLQLHAPPGLLAATSAAAATSLAQDFGPNVHLTQEPGRPHAPMVSALLGVPPEAEPRLYVTSEQSVTLPGHFSLPVAPHPAPLTDDLQPGRFTHASDATFEDAFYPDAPARIADEAWLRGQRIVRVEIYPFQYNPKRGTVLWHPQLQVRVDFHVGEESLLSQARPFAPDPAFEAVLAGTLLNYNEAKYWRTPPQAKDSFEFLPEHAAGPRYKIVVDQDGLYRLRYDDLVAAGLELDARMLRLTSQGREVAVHVTHDEAGRIRPGDALTFYGQRFRGAFLAERYRDEAANWMAYPNGWKPEFSPVMMEKYTNENVYWLSVGDQPGLRMEILDVASDETAPTPEFYRTATRVEESNLWWTFHFTDEDTWFWERATVGSGQVVTQTYGITLTALAADAGVAVVRGEVVLRSEHAHHHLRFFLNDHSEPLQEVVWAGARRHRFELEAPQAVLQEGHNRLHLVIDTRTTPTADIYFDWFEIEHDRVFRAKADKIVFDADHTEANDFARFQVDGFTDHDVAVYEISDPWRPRRVPAVQAQASASASADGYSLTFTVEDEPDARYLAVAAPAVRTPLQVSRYEPPDLHAPTNSADMIFITHQNLLTATETLADYRAVQGMRVAVVDVEDLYNQFNHGIFHPIAIKNFLRYAYYNWQSPAPSYVLLVGDGHWNFLDHATDRLGAKAPIYMPPNLAWVDPWQGEVDSANLLAAVVGEDILPDLHIGRLPVQSQAELEAVVAKIIAYEGAEWGNWQRRALFVADNVPDPAGDFVASSERMIADFMSMSLQAQRIYLNDFCGEPTSPPRRCPEVNTAIIETLNDTGALLVNYFGHASLDRWAHERILVNKDVQALTNQDRLPLVLSMSCLDGYWIYPNRTSLASEWVLHPHGGAIAAFSSTGLGVATGHDVLLQGFYMAVFEDGIRELGPATLAARLALFAAGRNYDLINTFTVFGDPALRMQLAPAQTYLPTLHVSD